MSLFKRKGRPWLLQGRERGDDFWSRPRKIGDLDTNLAELKMQATDHLETPTTPWERGLTIAVLYLIDELDTLDQEVQRLIEERET